MVSEKKFYEEYLDKDTPNRDALIHKTLEVIKESDDFLNYLQQNKFHNGFYIEACNVAEMILKKEKEIVELRKNANGIIQDKTDKVVELNVKVAELRKKVKELKEELEGYKTDTSKAAEMLRLAGCLDDIDNDVAEMVLKSIKKIDNNMVHSQADLMLEMQKIKEKLAAIEAKEE